MTFIKKLELLGFKSFANKTDITFPEGINCVIGSNGSGKSNIAEAINFVIGKRSKKELRAERLTDFIYNGGKRGKPAKFAKCKITFDNSDGVFPIKDKELRISRTVSKKGSLYTINGERCAREQVISILAHAKIDPDGHNIIMQGDIQKFVDMDPVERRRIIEEISGISIYEEKKHKSILHLQKVEEKIKEANILLTEKKKLMDELKEQKEFAETFKDAEKTLKIKKASILIKNKTIFQRQQDNLNKEIQKKDQTIKKIEEQIQDFENKIKEFKTKIEDIAQRTREKGFEEASKIREKVTLLKSEIKLNYDAVSNLEEQIERAKLSQENLLKNLEKQTKELAKERVELLDVQNKLKSLRTHTEDREKEINSLMGRDSSLLETKKKMDEINEKIYETRGLINQYDSKKNLLTKAEGVREQLKEKESELKDIIKDFDDEMKKNSDFISKESETENKIRNLQNKTMQLSAKKKFAVDSMNLGTRSVLKLRDAKSINGIIGTVLELGTADENYKVALTVSAGARVMNIVVDSETTAKKCIQYLRDNNRGFATFLPLSKIRSFKNYDKSILKTPGVIDYAKNLVKYDSRYEPIFSSIFRDTLIVKDFNTAIKIGIGKCRMVTLKGDVFDRSGAITGGSRLVERTLGFKTEDIDKELKKIKIQLEEYRKYYEDLFKNLKDSNSIVEDLREKKTRFETETSLFKEKLVEIQEELGEFKLENYEDAKESLKNLEKQKESFTQIKTTTDDKLLNQKQKELENLRKETQILSKKEADAAAKIEHALVKEMKSLESSIQNAKVQEQKFISDLKSTRKGLVTTEKDLKKQEQYEEKFRTSLKGLGEEENRINKKIEEYENKTKDLEKRQDKHQQGKNTIEVEKATVLSKLEGIYKQLEDYKEIKIGDIKESLSQLQSFVASLESKIDKMKQRVNLGAWEAYKETEKDYTEISGKTQKLIDEEMEIKKVMDEIESKKKSTFMETFNNINEYFDGLFRKLSPGGEAQLVVQNPDDPFEAGVDVKAKPAGKKMVSMKSMSGGEKTITALSFIFSIQYFDPAPFYILDEVDAALDRANSETLAQLLREQAEKAQFIIVTHNDAVIVVADILYGVHMRAEGSSALVSLKLPKTQQEMADIKKKVINPTK